MAEGRGDALSVVGVPFFVTILATLVLTLVAAAGIAALFLAIAL
jgi:hypothetical protein